MSVPGPVVDAQTDALLRRVARECDSRCRRALGAADEQAAAIVARAHADARARVRQAVADERAAVALALGARRAALDTARRQATQAAVRSALDDAWAAMPGALQSVWDSPDARARWCRSARAAAEAVIETEAPREVEIDAAADDATEAAVRAAFDDGPYALRRVDGLGAGLRVRAGRARVDASWRGLLASRERVESALLAEILGGDAPEGRS
ncbi:MAG: hypothetical protein U1F08_11565 [Steroidobacteraceae bacterium]